MGIISSIYFNSVIWGLWINFSFAQTSSIDASLIAPILIQSPGPEYSYDSLDYGMNMGIERTHGERIWMCWTAGGDDPSSFMLLAWSDDAGYTWSEPSLVVDAQDPGLDLPRTVQNGNIWLDPDGRLWFFFDQAMLDFDGRAGVWATVCHNPDSPDPQWSRPVRIWHGTAKSKPIVLHSGEWLLPVSLLNRSIIHKELQEYHLYPELDSLRMAHVFISEDHGKSWQRRGAVSFPNPSYDEHHVIQLKNGSLWMTARTKNGIWQSFSADNGFTWSPPEKYLNHTSSRHFIRRLSSGNIVLVKHGLLDEKTAKRSHLYAFLSEDEGKSWSEGLLIDDRTGISYPDGFENEDGVIHLTYDYERSRKGHIYLTKFTEEDMRKGRYISTLSAKPYLISEPKKVKQ